MDISNTKLPELSDETVRDLKILRKDGGQRFYAYVKSLRINKWPLRAVATPLGVSRTAVSNWEKAFDASVHLPVVEDLPAVVPKAVKPVYHRFELTPSQSLELESLAHEAAKVRRFTDYNAKSRKDAEKLEELLRKYTAEGASLGQLAKACKVSRSSIAQRLRKTTNEAFTGV